MEAIGNWNSKQNYVNLSPNGIVQAGDIYVSQASYSWGSYALTVFSCSGRTMVNANLRFNSRIMGGLNVSQMRRVAIHEIGHSLGLDHTNKEQRVYHGNQCLRELPEWELSVFGRY